jgi:hypothetical protein
MEEVDVKIITSATIYSSNNDFGSRLVFCLDMTPCPLLAVQ